ncbi:lipoprotein insertase outer membrane protein LolB [Pseudoalteromonas sp.]|uniref:lipoprotein insertase outer membrane protein LolB n=1 Tax=Pseudoalteromonas sp. TaxID=53249 RepID=UPI003566568A
MIRQYFILVIVFLFLAGCAQKRDLKTELYDDWKVKLAEQDIWQVTGKMAFISPEERQSANLNWQQGQNNNHLVLTTFIGTRILSLQQNAHQATLEFDDELYIDHDAAALLKRLTGFTLPVNDADSWLKGVIDNPSLTVDPLGRAKRVLWFDNSGKRWQIDYANYVQQHGFWLPTRLTLTQQKIKIKIQLYHWQFN